MSGFPLLVPYLQAASSPCGFELTWLPLYCLLWNVSAHFTIGSEVGFGVGFGVGAAVRVGTGVDVRAGAGVAPAGRLGSTP